MDFTTEKKFNDIWSNKPSESSLKDWQISQLGEVASNLEAKRQLQIWSNNSFGNISGNTSTVCSLSNRMKTISWSLWFTICFSLDQSYLLYVVTSLTIFSFYSVYFAVNQEILCESVLVLFLYSTFASVSWMFIQGLYPNFALIFGTAPISARYQLPIYNFIVVPAAFVVVYVVAMLFKDQESCWSGYSEMKDMWILMDPSAFELVVDMLHIWHLYFQMCIHSIYWNLLWFYRAAAKGTAILFPVHGINNLILLYNPGGGYNKYFVSLNTCFAPTQGIFVAIVYCFADKEVCAAIRRFIERANSRRMDNVNRVELVPPLATVMEILSRRQNDQCSSINLENSV